ncbi:AMP-binding protein [Microbacterium lacticum]|uniref:Acetyl-CoA synthetase n=1 Tax=Microbacterium lacticum TaxID=33885 RepID=A0A4Y3UKV4_9MICO|nr:AMP-binding protein [Microbacterium lacticum]TQM95033.1 acetyl-CoA synthetase [Microbacterium lacticum]GEB95326.1 acetyl-CoA synthetase [Microbacterium lacticum]GGI70332.1 acetyl-CoA synthetase [Microbacterium lacticum]
MPHEPFPPRPAGRTATAATEKVRAARDLLFAHADDYDGAVAAFAWPELDEFNFALEWFDVVAREQPDRAAVTIIDADLGARSWTYGELSRRSDQVAVWLSERGLRRGDRVVVMLGNQIELWETMLALTKLGAVAIPTTTLLSADDLAYRVTHSGARAMIAPAEATDRAADVDAGVLRIAVGEASGWISFADSDAAGDVFEPDGPTPAGELNLLYFTSGTTSATPKLVRHTHVSYPVGHLSTLWWLGVRPGDVHMNISSPGWGKHAWSNFFSPFLAEATVFVYTYDRFDAATLMHVMDTHKVTTFCAPPTVWRMLIQADLTQLTQPPRELLGAGEPLNPEVIARVRDAWGATIRDGYGQTEMTCAIGNSPGQIVKDGSMGRPLPGYPVVLLDPDTGEVTNDEGEICLDLSHPILGLMDGYHDAPDRTARATEGGYYRTGDIASRDDDGNLTYVGRRDDVFKASDYKISPFELESVLLEHPAVAEAAVVPSPDPVRLAVPKAYVRLSAQAPENHREAAREVFAHSRARLSAYQRVRRLEFVDELPKTISGKIRRVELRAAESARGNEAPAGEFSDRDFR